MVKYQYQVINRNTGKVIKTLSVSTKVELSEREKLDYLWQFAIDNQRNINQLDLLTKKVIVGEGLL